MAQNAGIHIIKKVNAHFQPKLDPQYILGRTSMSKYLTNLRKGKPENCMRNNHYGMNESSEIIFGLMFFEKKWSQKVVTFGFS